MTTVCILSIVLTQQLSLYLLLRYYNNNKNTYIYENGDIWVLVNKKNFLECNDQTKQYILALPYRYIVGKGGFKLFLPVPCGRTLGITWVVGWHLKDSE